MKLRYSMRPGQTTVLILFSILTAFTLACGGGGRSRTPCTTDAECAPVGGTCEESFFGSSCNIPCDSDADCICRSGQCIGTGFPCESATDCQASCNPFPWSNGRTVHLCETNVKACGKHSGVTCGELTYGVSSCRNTETETVVAR